MKKSYISILLLFLVMILAISAASAAEIDDTSDSDALAADEATVDEVVSTDAVDDVQTATEEAEVLTDAGDGNNFTSLQTLIDKKGETVILEKDYIRVEGDSSLNIIEDTTIVGNNHKIDGANLGGIFKVNSGVMLVLSGVTLVNGNSDYGGAVYNEGTLDIFSSTFENNTATKDGGAIYNNGTINHLSESAFINNNAEIGGAIYTNSDLTIEGSVFHNNAAYQGADESGFGGAIFTTVDSILTIEDTQFINNAAFQGGAIYAYGVLDIDNCKFIGNNKAVGHQMGQTWASGGAICTENSFTVKNSNFTNNYAAENGAAIYSWINSDDDYSYSVIDNCIFEDNYAETYYGAIYFYHKALTQGLMILNSQFINNSANIIGALLSYAGDLTIENTAFTDNEARTSYMGAVYYVGTDDAKITVKDSNFTGNKAATHAGALYVQGGSGEITGSNFINNAGGHYGALFFNGDELNISDSTFENNKANGKANAIYLYSGTLDLSGNTIAGDEAEIIVYNGEIISQINVNILENDTVSTNTGKYMVTAEITDDNNNTIANAKGFKFVTEGAEVEAIYNATTKLYERLITLPAPGVFTVNASYTDENLIVKTATIQNYKGSYQDLQKQINDAEAGSTLDLEYDFAYSPDLDGASYVDGVTISKALTINGNGYTISGSNAARIFRTTAAVEIKNLTLVDGSTAGSGAAIYATDDLIVNDCVFADNNITTRTNSERDGGAIYAEGSNLTVTNSKFIGNIKNYVDGVATGQNIQGGAIATFAANTLIDNCEFIDNAGFLGGAIVAWTSNHAGVIVVNNSKFENNHGYQGGAIFAQSLASLTVDNSEFTGNYVTATETPGKKTWSSGGAIDSEVKTTITNSNFTANSAQHNGGAVYIQPGNNAAVVDKCRFVDNEAGAWYGALYYSGSNTLTVSNSYFNNNNAPKASAIGLLGGNLALSKNTIVDDEEILLRTDSGYTSTVTSQINITVMDNGNYDFSYRAIDLYAAITDDNGNVITDSGFKFLVGTTEVNATFNPETKYYEAKYTPTAEEEYLVSMNYAGTATLAIKTATISFTRSLIDIQNMIDAAEEGATITLDGNYKYVEELDSSIKNGIVIDKAITIDGNGSTISGSNAARIFNVQSTVTINNTKLIDGSTAGNGGAITSTGDLTIDNCVFENNNITTRTSAERDGGAIFAASGSKLIVLNSNFTNNIQNYALLENIQGGAIGSYSSDVTIDNCIFTGNSALIGGAVMLWTDNTDGVALINNSKFIDNFAYQGGAVFAQRLKTLTVDNSVFNNNEVKGTETPTKKTWATAGALFADAQTTITNSNFTGNKAEYNGGAVYIQNDYNPNTNGLIDNCRFEDNTAGKWYGALAYLASKTMTVKDSYFNNNKAEGKLNAITLGSGNLVLENNTITGDDCQILIRHVAEWPASAMISTIKVTVLDGEVKTINTFDVELTAKVTDDKGNLIQDTEFSFTINDEEVPAGYDNGVYKANYTLPVAGIYPVNITYKEDNLEVVNATIISTKGTFTDLQNMINNTAEGTTLVLPYNFTYNAEIDGDAFKAGVVIGKALTVDGNGSTISGADAARIFQLNNNTINIKNITFTNGHANTSSTKTADWGGAIYSNGAYKGHVISDCKFYNNTAYNGGAIYLGGDASDIIGCEFEDNNATASGGAVFLYGWNDAISDSTFKFNMADELGGAVACYSTEQAAKITNSVFIGNVALKNGGAVSMQRAAGKITDSNFTGNTAYNGGAVYWGSEGGSISGGEFIENEAFGDLGGAIFAEGTGLTITSTFTENYADNGGAIAVFNDTTITESKFTNNTADNYGGAIYVNGSAKLDITKSAMKNNTATVGSSIYSNGTIGSTIVNATILDNKTWNDTGLGEIYVLNATLTDDMGNNIYDPNFRFTVNGVEIADEPLYDDETGLYTLGYVVEKARLNVISTSYNAANLQVFTGALDIPLANVTEFTVKVESIVEGENATVFITLIGVNDVGLDSIVTLIVNNNEYPVLVKNGTGNRTIENLTHGSYPVVAMLNESTNYNNAINSTVFYVKATTTITIAGPEEDVVYGEPVTIKVTVTTSDEIPFNGLVYLGYYETEFGVVINAGEGSYTFDANTQFLSAGEQEFIAVFEGNNDYNASESNTIKFNVTAKDINDEDIYVDIYGDAPGNVTVDIYGPKGTYNVTVDETVYQVEVGEDGYGSIEIDDLTLGDKEATIAIDDDNYEGTITETFTYKYVPEFTVEIIGTYPTAEITIEGTDGTYVVYIDEEHQTEITVKEGTGSGNISGLAAGVYEDENEAYVYFVETDDYQYASTYVPFEIAKATPVIKVEAAEATYPADVVVTVTSDVAGTYTVKVGDKSEEVTLEANVAKDVTFEGLDANEEGYAIEVTYEETENYTAAVNDTEKVIVKKADVVFNATVATPVAYPNDVIVTVNTTVAGKVTVKLDKDYVFDVAAGVTDLTIPGLAVGTYSSKIVQFDADNYAAAEDEITFEVTKGTPAFDVDVVVGKDTYPGSVVVIVTSDVDGTYNVAVGTQIAPVTVSKGVGYTTFNNVASGKQNATVTFVEDASYKETSLDKEFTINQAAPEFTVEVAEATYPDPVQVSIKGTDGTYHILGTTITVTGGVGSGSVEGLAAGTYTDVKVTFDAAGDYAAGETTVSFTVKQKASEVTVTPVTETVTYPGEVSITYSASEEAITITVTDANGNDVAFTPADGKIALTNLAAGTYTVTVAIADSQNITGSSDSTTFTVGQAASSVVITPVTETITYPGAVNVTVTAVNGVADITVTDASGATVDFTIDNDKVVLTNLAAGTYTVSAAIAGTENITGSSDSITFTVAKAAMTPTVSVPEKAEIGENFTVIAEDYYGDVTVEINGVNYALNENISLAEGTYNVKVIFAGNENYTGITVEKTINVTKKSAGENPLNITVPENTTTPTFSIELPEDATGYLLVDVDGEQYYAPLVNGTASVQTAPLAGGNHTVTVTYTGDDKYAGFSNTTNMTIDSNVTADTALDVPASSENTPTFSVNLPSDATGFLTVDVDGKKYAAVVENGKASISVPGLSEGNHNVTVIYSGDAKYPTLTKDATVNVHIPVYKITQNKNINVVYSAKATYKVLITKDGKAVGAGESVTIKYNGKTYTVKTDAKGYATFKPTTKVKVKKYTITATYKGVTVKNTVNVKHLIKASNKKIKKSKKVNKIKVKTYKVNGKYLKGKKLTLKIKGKKVKAKINKKGVATFKLKKSITKKLKAGKKYKYTVTYGKDKVTKKVKVKR